MVISKVRRNIHYINVISHQIIYYIKCYLLLVGGILLESSYKICSHCHQDINCATPHKRSQIPALASVQCRAVAGGAKLDQSAISRDRTNFPFPPPRHTSAADTGHGTHNPHQRQHSNIYGRESNWIQQFLSLVVKVLEASTAPCTGAACGGCTEGVGRVCMTITITAMAPSVTSLTLAP